MGLHATDVLNIQNETQTYHEDMEGIPVYINKLEDAQKQSNQAGNPIKDPTLVLFSANAMLRTDRFPQANNIWEEIPGAYIMWARWKAIYSKIDMAKKFNNTAQSRQDHFGAHGAFDKVPGPEGEMPQLSVAELDGYFSSLANADTTEK